MTRGWVIRATRWRPHAMGTNTRAQCDSTFGLNPDHDKIERELPPSRALSAGVARDLLLVASRNAGACCANAVRENPRSVSIHVDVDLSPCDCVVCVVDLSMYYSLCPDRDHLTLSLFLFQGHFAFCIFTFLKENL